MTDLHTFYKGGEIGEKKQELERKRKNVRERPVPLEWTSGDLDEILTGQS